MNSTSNIVYISIESRKGGVGKTTVALTLAEILQQKEYQILLVDMDIIGTRVDPTFIKDNQHLLHEVSYKGKAVNLLQMFNKVYMSGKNVPVFMPANEKQSNYLTFERGKCNIIGSDLYSKKEDGEDKKEEEEEKNTILEDPRVLYDAFHAYWMIEFVKEIVKSFEKAMNRGDKIVVVFDNSPGFSSIENGIHDFLTDIGTEKGKFVLVSSIDQQDLDACRQTKEIINNIIKDKLEARDYYCSLMGDKDKEEKKNTSSAFNSVWNSLCVSNGQLPEYYSIDHEIKDKKFIGIIVNKVPRNIVEDIEGRILEKDEEFPAPFLNHLLYKYNSQLLDEHDIKHHTNFNSGFDEFKLSGDIAKIEEDDEKYLKFLDYLKQIGLNILFKPMWSPLALFKEIISDLEKEEALKDVSEFSVSKIYGTVQREKGFEKNVETVKKFVLKNLKEGVDLHNDFVTVFDFVKNRIEFANNHNTPLDLHPDSPRLELIGGFVSNVGLAIYRLNKYDVICELLNELIKRSLEDVETMEQLDTDAISGMIEDILAGRENVEDIKGTVSAMINKTIIARELRYAINQIIKQWEL